MLELHIGQKVMFDPSVKDSYNRKDDIPVTVTGTVVGINNPHKWFSVEYGGNMRTSFKFSDYGGSVVPVG